MEALVDQELKEVNSYLVRYDEAHRNYTLFMGGSLVCTAALPILLLVNWLLDSASILGGAVIGVVFLLGGYGLGLWWRFRIHALFREIQSRCRKLQRAGYVVHKKPSFLRNVISATTEQLGPDDEVLDFERLDAAELHYRMI